MDFTFSPTGRWGKQHVTSILVQEPGTRLINQGEDGDCLYIIEEGQMDCYKKPPAGGDEVLVKECKAGDYFGELALLYNSPRSAEPTTICHQNAMSATRFQLFSGPQQRAAERGRVKKNQKS